MSRAASSAARAGEESAVEIESRAMVSKGLLSSDGEERRAEPRGTRLTEPPCGWSRSGVLGRGSRQLRPSGRACVER